jgi:putative transposase
MAVLAGRKARQWWMFAGSPSRGDEVAATLDELAREGARRMIAAALEAEVEQYVGAFVEDVDEDGRRLVVRNGRARERKLTVGSRTVAIRAPGVNDKRVDEQTRERQKFSSRILPTYARRSPKVTDVLPVLYPRGVSTGDFAAALRDLLGEDASGLSASSISRLTEQWQADHAAFRASSLRFHRDAYLFIDGIHLRIRLGEDDRLLVVIGVREDGEKELLAVEDGYRESTESWAVVLCDLKTRGLNTPKLVTGDGALGAWAALRDVFPEAGEQRCWVHKTANVLDAMPKRLQPRAKALLHEMAEAPTEADARAAKERSARSLTSSTLRQRRSWTATGARCRRSTRSRPSTGATAGPRTRSSRASRPSAYAGRSPRARDPRRPRLRWPTSCWTPRRCAGADQRPRTHRRCSRRRPSRTASASATPTTTTTTTASTRRSPPERSHATSSTTVANNAMLAQSLICRCFRSLGRSG